MHYLRYELGLARERVGDALRFGSAFHRGLEARNNGRHIDDAVAVATDGYDTIPTWADPIQWQQERAQVAALLRYYDWRYSLDDAPVIAAERVFDLPLVNPLTGRRSRTFRIGGKIDAICEYQGRQIVREYKTCGESIAPDSGYWLRLRQDPQVTMYVHAARELGYDVSGVLYDVVRKPTIRVKMTESIDDYYVRLCADIRERPDYYYQRREVPRIDADIAEFRAELWQQAEHLAQAKARGWWPRNVGRWTCVGCEFTDPCLQGISVSRHNVPNGFVLLSDVHPELQEEVVE